MSMYAIVNPATGARVREYPTISDADLDAAIAAADSRPPVVGTPDPAG